MKELGSIELNSILSRAKFIIADKLMLSHHQGIANSLKSASVFYLEDPEKSKNIEKYSEAIDFFLLSGLKRKDEIFVIGGGATSDFGGFVASTIFRGVNWTVIPTTLLSMVDASIGGKVGLNSKRGKNLIGSFHRPSENYLHLDFLDSLAPEELLSGMGEVIKYAFLSTDILKLLKGQDFKLIQVIQYCQEFKRGIVARDYKESGERKTLNLGHTFGHAFEHILNLPHGLAVTKGLEFILKLYDSPLISELEQLQSKLGIIQDNQRCSFDNFWDRVTVDKKTINPLEIELILPIDIGQVKVRKVELRQLKEKILNHEIYKYYFS